MVQICGCNQSASLVGNNVGNAISNNPSILYSFTGEVPILSQSMSWTCEESTLSRNSLVSSTSLHTFGRRATKEEGWEEKCSAGNL